MPHLPSLKCALSHEANTVLGNAAIELSIAGRQGGKIEDGHERPEPTLSGPYVRRFLLRQQIKGVTERSDNEINSDVA
jgi:hypothetical protein